MNPWETSVSKFPWQKIVNLGNKYHQKNTGLITRGIINRNATKTGG